MNAHCQSGLHCPACVADDRLRRDIFATSGLAVCPKNYSINNPPPVVTLPKPDNLDHRSSPPSAEPQTPEQTAADQNDGQEGRLLIDRMAVCEKCPDHCVKTDCSGKSGLTCRLMRDGHCTPCQFAAYLKRPYAVCPNQTTQQWGV